MKEIGLFEQELTASVVYPLSGIYSENEIYIKREDLIPFSFGGNKARKAAEFYHDIRSKKADVVMTYGSNGSNHCRIIVNMAAAMGLPCHIIAPEDSQQDKLNTRIVKELGATIEACPVELVADTIVKREQVYLDQGLKPYFIMGGGHGNLGTSAYVKAYQEIIAYERTNHTYFDYIFHASGTGTTQAGLVCGKLLSGRQHQQIVGISIAREEKAGRGVIRTSIEDYLGEQFNRLYEEDELIFTDAYRCGGYGKFDQEVERVTHLVMRQDGIAMDSTYVGKAFRGMCDHLKAKNIRGQRILFVHTGGTPLYFDRFTREQVLS